MVLFVRGHVSLIFLKSLTFIMGICMCIRHSLTIDCIQVSASAVLSVTVFALGPAYRRDFQNLSPKINAINDVSFL